MDSLSVDPLRRERATSIQRSKIAPFPSGPQEEQRLGGKQLPVWELGKACTLDHRITQEDTGHTKTQSGLEEKE